MAEVYLGSFNIPQHMSSVFPVVGNVRKIKIGKGIVEDCS